MKYRVKIADKDRKDEITIGEDEIIEIKYSIGLAEKDDFANNRSRVEMELTGKIIANLEGMPQESGNRQDDLQNGENEEAVDLYEQNKKNVISLAGWAESYMKENDYRNVEVNVHLGADRSIGYIFENMFVWNFSQEFSIEKGIGIFTLQLRQKFYQKEKIKIK